MQSNDYKPGVSGWKLEKGVLYINSSTIQVGALPAAPQLVTVQASSWPESSLPIGALEQVKFIQGEIEAIPEQWRDSAELSTRDDSYYLAGSDIRTTLTYKRPETAAEAEARSTARAKAGRCFALVGGGFELYDERGVVRVRFGSCLDAEVQARTDADQAARTLAEAIAAAAKQGALEGYALIKADQSRAAAWSVKLQVNDSGRYVASGFGVPVDVESTPEGPRASEPPVTEDAADLLAMVGAKISDTELADCLREWKCSRAQEVREVIAGELRPGGLLHRHHGSR